MNGPFELELKVHLTDGERSAIVTYSLPVGVYPTKEDIQKAMAETLDKVKAEVGGKWRFQTRNEFENEIISSRYGGVTPHFATAEYWD